MADLSPVAVSDGPSLSVAETSPSSSQSWEMDLAAPPPSVLLYFGSAAESPAEPAAKRKRLAYKQPLTSSLEPLDLCDATPEDDSTKDSVSQGPNIYAVFYGRVRRWLQRVHVTYTKRGGVVPVALRKPLRKCTEVERLALVRSWVAGDDQSPEWLKKWALDRYGGKVGTSASETKWFDGKELLLTWNGAWGLLTLEEAGLGWTTVDEVCRVLAKHDLANRLASMLQTKMVDWQHALDTEHIVWSI